MDKVEGNGLSDLRVEGDHILFLLHGKPFNLHVEEHMRRHITRETEGYAGFNVVAQSPYARIEMMSYTPELREMDDDELARLITIFQEDIVNEEEG
jgi:hypothetical protein